MLFVYDLFILARVSCSCLTPRPHAAWPQQFGCGSISHVSGEHRTAQLSTAVPLDRDVWMVLTLMCRSQQRQDFPNDRSDHECQMYEIVWQNKDRKFIQQIRCHGGPVKEHRGGGQSSVDKEVKIVLESSLSRAWLREKRKGVVEGP